MHILVVSAIVVEYVPALLHSILCRVVKSAEAKVVKDGFHSVAVDGRDVVLECCQGRVPACDVLVGLKRVVTCPAQRPMVLPMPVLKLYSVDVIAVKVADDVVDGGFTHDIETGKESVTRKSGPVAGHVDSYSSKDFLAGRCGFVNLGHVPFVVPGRCGPAPFR